MNTAILIFLAPFVLAIGAAILDLAHIEAPRWLVRAIGVAQWSVLVAFGLGLFLALAWGIQ